MDAGKCFAQFEFWMLSNEEFSISGGAAVPDRDRRRSIPGSASVPGCTLGVSARINYYYEPVSTHINYYYDSVSIHIDCYYSSISTHIKCYYDSITTHINYYYHYVSTHINYYYCSVSTLRWSPYSLEWIPNPNVRWLPDIHPSYPSVPISTLNEQGYLAHKKPPPLLGPPLGPRHRPAVGSCKRAVSNERGIPVTSLSSFLGSGPDWFRKPSVSTGEHNSTVQYHDSGSFAVGVQCTAVPLEARTGRIIKPRFFIPRDLHFSIF